MIKQKYNGHRLDEEIVRSILTFSFFFTITICVMALGLSLMVTGSPHSPAPPASPAWGRAWAR